MDIDVKRYRAHCRAVFKDKYGVVNNGVQLGEWEMIITRRDGTGAVQMLNFESEVESMIEFTWTFVEEVKEVKNGKS